MSRRVAFFLLLLRAVCSEVTRLPEEFTIKEQYLSLTSTFDIETEFESFAIARKRFLAWTTTFDLENAHQDLLATAKTRFFAWGTVADVETAGGESIGWIEEELVRIFPWAEYRIFNAEKKLVAIAKMDFWGTEFSIANPDKPEAVYATVCRPFIHFFRDSWTVKVLKYSVFEEGLIDPRLLVLLAVFQTDKDNRARLRNEIIGNLRYEFDDFEGTRIPR